MDALRFCAPGDERAEPKTLDHTPLGDDGSPSTASGASKGSGSSVDAASGASKGGGSSILGYLVEVRTPFIAPKSNVPSSSELPVVQKTTF